MHHIHILWHHTTLFMTSHALYLWHHSHYIWHCIHCICIITTTLSMISDQLHVWHHTHFMYDILCTVYNVTSTLFDFTPCYLSHYIHCILTSQCIRHHTHDNVSIVSAISPTISDTISTVSVSSNPGYQLYHTHSLNSITHIICITSYSVCMALHELFKTSHPYMYDITPSIFMTSYPIYMVSPILLSWQHYDYTCHLTHYIWHHRHYICVVTPIVSMTSQQVWKSSHLAYVWHHEHSTWHHIHTLWHQSSSFMTSQPQRSWDQIAYIWHQVTVYGISSPIPVTSQSLYLKHQTHYGCEFTSTIFKIKHTVLRWYNHYIWYHTLHILSVI